MMCFHVYPGGGEVYFCWELPHRTQMMNILMSPGLFDPERVQMLKRWENLQLEYFGFKKNEDGFWIENEMFRGDTLMTASKPEDKKVKLIIA